MDNAEEDYLVDQTLSKRKLEEEEFYIDLAMQETQRWIEGVSKKPFSNQDNAKQSLASGVHLCQLLNSIKPGCVKRINKLPTLMAMMDNLNVFIQVCKHDFGLNSAQLFSVKDLLPISEKDIENAPPLQIKLQEFQSLRSIAVTIFWLARQVQSPFQLSTKLDYSAFSAIVSAKENQPSTGSVSSPSGGGPGRFQPGSHSAHDSVDSGAFIDGASDTMPMAREEGGRGLGSHVRRFSSCDSLEEGQGHARQLSTDSWESSGTVGGSQRKLSNSSGGKNALQFVALKPAENLAKAAEETIHLVKEGKTRRASFEVEDDWQSESWKQDLSSWKMRRKSSTKCLAISAFKDALPEEDSQRKTETRKARPSSAIVSQYPRSDDEEEDEAFISPGSHELNFRNSAISSRTDNSYSGPVPAPRQVKSKSQDSGIGSASPKAADDAHTDSSSGSETHLESKDVEEPLKATDMPPQHAAAPTKPTIAKNTPTAPIKMVDGTYNVCLEADPDGEGSFGLSIKGGLDAITVDGVTPGLAADKAGILEGDELLEINDHDLGGRNKGYCMLLLNESRRDGSVNLLVSRVCSKVSPAAWKRKASAEASPQGLLAKYERQEQSSPAPAPAPAAVEEPLLSASAPMPQFQLVNVVEDDEVKTESEGESQEGDDERESPQPVPAIAGEEDTPDGAMFSAMSRRSEDREVEDALSTAVMDQRAIEEQYEKLLSSPASVDSEGAKRKSALQEQRSHFLGLKSDKAGKSDDTSGPGAEGRSAPPAESGDSGEGMIVQPRAGRAGDAASRLSRRSLGMDGDERRRMEEWAREQDRLQQHPYTDATGVEEQFEREQRELKAQYEMSQRQAERVEESRRQQMQSSAPTATADPAQDRPDPSSHIARNLANLSVNLHEKDARQRAAQRLMDIKRRMSSTDDQPATNDSRPAEPRPSKGQDSWEAPPTEQVPDEAEMELQRREAELKKMEDHIRAEQQKIMQQKEQLRMGKGKAAARPELERQSAQYSDVMKYFDQVETPTIFDRERTPPPMSRKDVININRKSGTWEKASQPAPAPVTPVTTKQASSKPRTWSERQVEKEREAASRPAPVNASRPVANYSSASLGAQRRGSDKPSVSSESAAPWERKPSEQPKTGRKISSIFDKEDETVTPKHRAKPKDSGSTPQGAMSREDVMKMTREKPRYSMTSETAVKYNPPRSSSIAGDNREAILRHQPEEPKKEPSPTSSSQGTAPNFKGNLAIFEQKAKDADDYWKKVQTDRETKHEMRKSKSLQSAWKSFDVNPKPEHSNTVANARQERAKELAMIRGVREREDPVDGISDSTEGTRMREERRKELEAIRRMNRELSLESERQKSEEEERLRQERLKEIESVRANREEIARKEDEERERRERELALLRDKEESQMQGRRGVPSEAERKRQREAQLEAEARQREYLERERMRKMARDEEERERSVERDRQRAQQERMEREQQLAGEQERYQREQEREREANAAMERRGRFAQQQQPLEEPIRREQVQPQHHQMEDTEVYNIPRRAPGYQQPPADLYGPGGGAPPTNGYAPEGPADGGAVNGLRSPPREDYGPPRPSYPSAETDPKYGYDPTPYDPTPASFDTRSQPSSYGAAPAAAPASAAPWANPRPAARPQPGDRPGGVAPAPVSSNGSVSAPYSDYRQPMGGPGGVGYPPSQGPPAPSQRHQSPSKASQKDEDIVSVSARQICIYCNKELGKGAAMVIESLHLYYHVQCFRCCVCHTLLSHGALGADVRVRGNKLHCRNCYSNDEAGIKYSAV